MAVSSLVPCEPKGQHLTAGLLGISCCLRPSPPRSSRTRGVGRGGVSLTDAKWNARKIAHGLRNHGLDVAVYERDAHPGARPQGYRIQLDEPGLTGLEHCVSRPLFRLCLATAGSPPARISVRNRHLDALADKAALRGSPAGDGQGPLAFNRPTLRQVMLAGLRDHVHYGARLTAYRHEADGTVTAHFADGRTASADLLVGADGVNSTVRRALLPEARIEDAGLRLIYGKIPLTGSARADVPPWVFDSIFTVVTGGPGHPHVGLGPVEFNARPEQAGPAHVPPVALSPVDDYVACMVGAPSDHPAVPPFEVLRALTPAQLRDVTREVLVGEWHEDVHHLLDLWDTHSLFALRISTAVPVPAWESRPVTLIGDAIHAMSPVLAMGANTALRDAGELTHAIAGAVGRGERLVDAVRAYENRMTDYAFSIVTDSRRTGQQRVGQR